MKGPFDLEVKGGREIYFHNDCLVFFPEATFKGQIVSNLSKSFLCLYCQNNGLVIKCDNNDCDKYTHISCKDDDWILDAFDFLSLCPEHKHSS